MRPPAMKTLAAVVATAVVATLAAAFHCRMDPNAASDACGLPYQLSNFQAMYPCDPAVLVGRPKNVTEVQAMVRAFPRAQGVGVGHSWWPDPFCAGDGPNAVGIVTTEFTNLEPFYGTGPGGGDRPAVEVDEAALTVEVEAGLTQRQLLQYLASFKSSNSTDGYTLNAFSWFIDQTIGGAVATGTHGSTLKWGSVSNQAVGLEVVTADGEARWYTAETDPHLFRALKISVGRLGVITRVRLMITKQQAVKRTLTEMSFTDFVSQIQQVQATYRAAMTTEDAELVSKTLEVINETQALWLVPQNQLWRTDYTRLDKEPPNALLNSIPDLNQSDYQLAAKLFGPAAGASTPTPSASPVVEEKSDSAVPDVYPQDLSQKRVPVNPTLLFNAQLISAITSASIKPTVESGTFARDQAYVSMTETGTRTTDSTAVYDQYEVSVPLQHAGDCLALLQKEIYGPKALWQGFRTPPLIRFVSNEDAYLALTHDGPRMFINLEDYVTHNGAAPNTPFFAVVSLLMSSTCAGRMHWGKAGWLVSQGFNVCFDGQAQFGDNWCNFGCAVQTLDPTGKFAGQADIWNFNAIDSSGGHVDFGSCCTADGFDTTQCTCAPAPRTACTTAAATPTPTPAGSPSTAPSS